MKTQSEIYKRVKEMIPPDLWDKYSDDSFGEMATKPDLAQWKDELEQAESDWWKAES